MKIQVSKLFDLGLWDEYCRITGTNVWAVNEGLLRSDEFVDVPQELFNLVISGKP